MPSALRPVAERAELPYAPAVRWWSALAAMIVGCRVGDAGAEPSLALPSVLLRVDDDASVTPSACPSPTELEAMVAARLGRAPFTDSSPSLLVDVRRTLDGEALIAVIEARTPSASLGRQRLVSRSQNCRELTEAVALAVSIVVEQATESEAAIVARPLQAKARSAAPPTVAVTSTKWASTAGAKIAFGVGPEAAFAVTAGARAQWAGWTLGGAVGIYGISATNANDGRVATRLRALEAVGCRTRGPLALCLLASLGELRGQGLDGPRGRADTSVMVAFGIHAALEQRLGQTFGLAPFAELAISPIRTTLYLDRAVAWRSPLFQGALGLEWLVHFDVGTGR